MSTSDQHGPTLTRKQLREASFAGTTTVATEEREEAPVEVAAPTTPPPVAPLPRAAEPVVVPPAASVADAKIGTAPLTRRQARAQERVLTGSVPTQEAVVPAAAAAMPAPVAEPAPAVVESTPLVTNVPTPNVPAERSVAEELAFEAPAWDPTAVSAGSSLATVFGAAVEERAEVDTPELDLQNTLSVDRQPPAEPAVPSFLADPVVPVAPVAPVVPVVLAAPVAQPVVPSWAADTPQESRPTVNASFGETLLAPTQAPTEKSSGSFEALLATDADTTGSQHSAPSALIFSQTPGMGALSGPVASTGEILVTGTMNLPDGLGSRGHALGAADGKEVDAVLLDRELAPGSSPTPIAASSAISTIKPAGEVIRPPEPDKGNKVMLALTITAGALALALVGALVVAFASGVFS